MTNGNLIRIGAASLALLALNACSTSTEPVEPLEYADLGLPLDAVMVPGSTIEATSAIPNDAAATITASPDGVDGSFTQGPDGTMRLVLEVADDAADGGYYLGMRVQTDSRDGEFNMPFIIDADGVIPIVARSADREGVLVLTQPQPYDVIDSPSVIEGDSTSDRVGYRLTAGDAVIAEATVDVVDGAFELELEFVNTCCTEMMLEVFQIGGDELAVAIPVSAHESS